MSRSKYWCFTLNNYTDAEYQAITSRGQDADITYCVVGKEVGQSGTPHLQGYIVFKERVRLPAVKSAICNRAHVEKARGTPEQAAEYCKKDNNFVEYGTLPLGRGTRSDIHNLVDRIKKGATRNEIRDEFPLQYLRYPKAITEWISDISTERTWQPDVIVHWGRTGTGKTRAVYQFIDKSSIYMHPGDHWFDGYNGQPVALFDDYNGSEFKLSYLLKLLDRYPFKVPIKGAYVNWIPKHIFITSNKSPDDWYPNAHEEQRRALLRRITTIKHFS